MSRITPASEWRKVREEGTVVKLPTSQFWVRLRPVALDMLLYQEGGIPDLLTPIAAKMLWDEIPRKSILEDVKFAQDFAALVNHVVPSAFLEPRIHVGPGDPADDEILSDDIPFSDKLEVFQLVIQSAEELVKFRDKQIGSLVSLPQREDVGTSPEPTSTGKR